MIFSRRTQIITGLSPDNLPVDALIAKGKPAILKGVVRDWPLVQQGLESPQTAIDYLKTFYNGRPVVRFTAPPEINGKFFYNDDVSGLNFTSEQLGLDVFFEEIIDSINTKASSAFYIGSTSLDMYLPGLRDKNHLPLAKTIDAYHSPLASIWIGTRTCASAHYDFSNNIAGCMVGHRRFTIFPPDQIHNLYPGPLEPTPGGQVISMVDFQTPDFAKHPNFKDAIHASEVAELEPGDLLFLPSMWWHQVEALDPFNVLINYWWNSVPDFIDTPQTTLLHALLSLRDRPDSEKQAWREVFEHYVFGEAERAGAHLPEHARGNLGAMDEMQARRLRALLLNRLNR